MFSLTYYNASPKDLKAHEVFTRGNFIAEYPTDKASQTIALYSLDTFYVEVTFSKVDTAVVDTVGIGVDEALRKYIV